MKGIGFNKLIYCFDFIDTVAASLSSRSGFPFNLMIKFDGFRREQIGKKYCLKEYLLDFPRMET